MARFSDSAHWRDTSRQTRFFVVDAAAAFPLLLFILHIKWWTFIVAVLSMTVLGTIEKFGFTIPITIRYVRAFLAGKRKVAAPWWKL